MPPQMQLYQVQPILPPLPYNNHDKLISNSQHLTAPSTGMDGRKYLIRVGCHNVRGLKTNTEYTYVGLTNLDICALSEHWFHSYGLNQLSTFHPEFSFHAVSHPTDEDPVYCTPRITRGRGGVAIAW